MYPRAAAYIISVKQSTYCQFGEVITAHGGAGGAARWGKELETRERREDERRKIYENVRMLGHFGGCVFAPARRPMSRYSQNIPNDEAQP